MSAWTELRDLGVTVRPLTDRDRPTAGGRWSKFRAPFERTLSELAKELRALDATRIALQLDFRERDLRLDGLPRADARLGHESVVLTFESRYGPLMYGTGEYDDWQDNLRAIVLSMEALRAVDRYGVSKRGEQYKGWMQLPASTDPADQIVTYEQAEEWISQYRVDEAESLATSVRRAVMATHPDRHPDRNGNDVDFRRTMRAKEILGL